MLTKDELQHIALLSRLKLTDEEVDTFVAQLSGVLDFVQKIQSIDTSTVTHIAHPSGLENVTRDDDVKEWSDKDVLLDAAGKRSKDYVETPSIF